MRRCNLPRWDNKETICPQKPSPKTDTPTAAALESDFQKMLQERSKLDGFWLAPPASSKQEQDKDK